MDIQNTSADQIRWAIIANPAAGSYKCQAKMPDFIALVEKNKLNYSLHWTERKGHAEILAAELAQSGYTHFMVAGGDGSLNEVVNGLCNHHGKTDEYYIASVPLGTANDWARYYGILNTQALIEAVKIGHYQKQDLGVIAFLSSGKKRIFANVLGIGFDSYVAEKLDKSGKSTFGALSYIRTLVQCLFSFRSPLMNVTADTFSKQGRFFTVNAGLTVFSGNKMRTVPHADPFDGLLAVTCADDMKPFEVISNLPRLYNGHLGKINKVHLTQEKAITVSHVEGQMPIIVEADGEIVGHTPVSITIVPAAIHVLLGNSIED